MTYTVDQLEKNSVNGLNLTGVYPNGVILPAQRAIAETITPNCLYLNSIYNATTKQVLCHVFMSGTFLVRVYADNSTELFQQNAIVNDVTYDYVYFDSSNNPVTYYKVNDDQISFSEYDFDTNTQQWVKYSEHYDTIPSDQKLLLSDFPYNDRIFAWSPQQIGFIVEYVEPLN